MFNFFHKNEVIPEKSWAIRNKLPAHLDVSINASEDGGYVASITNLPGCFTEGDTMQDLNSMINAAVFDYFDVPAEYVPFIQSYGPPQEVVTMMKAVGEHVLEGDGKMIFQRA